MTGDKRLTRVAARHRDSGLAVHGYEIHIGETEGPDCARPFAYLETGPDGATSVDGRVTGTYLHGLFADDAFRAGWLARRGAQDAGAYAAGVEAVLDALAAHMEAHLDVDGLLAAAAPVG